jgi:hypothetical protein
VRYRVKYSKLITVVVVVVMLGVGSFNSTAHAFSPWNDYWNLVQLVATRDIPGMYTWLGKQVAAGFTDLLAGEVIRAAFEYNEYTCFDKPLGLWWIPDSSWHILTCAAGAS